MNAPSRDHKNQRYKSSARQIAVMTAVCLFAAALLSSKVHSVEVSLEENRAERGNIGYVDMQQIFKLFPDTQKAKQNFEEVVRQAEEQVNQRKADLITLRAELAKLKMEHDFVARSPIAALPPILPPAQVEASTATSVSLSTSAVSKSTEPAVNSVMSLPGLGPEANATTPTPLIPQTPQASLQEIDKKMADKNQLLQEKDAEFKTYQAQVEKNLLDLENRRTEILLGKIYGIVQDVAREEGVSVVVDKSQILFGHKAVDLTDKVLQKLKTL